MKLYEQWKDRAFKDMNETEYNAFWTDYLEKEKNNYEQILGDHKSVVSGSLSELAEKFNMDLVEFTGFIDGINTSLIEEVGLEELDENSNIKLEIDFRKLYFNMLDAKAEWLYQLPEWDDILSVEERKEIKKEYGRSKTVVKGEKIGRNEPCPCGSGLKYKKCCGKN